MRKLLIYFTFLITALTGCQTVNGYKNCLSVRGYCNGSAPARVGESYIGEFLNGLRHGRGTFVWADGTKYTGQWEYNQATGNGTMWRLDGEITSGQFYRGSLHGKGKATYPENYSVRNRLEDCKGVISQEGFFVNNRFDKGTITYKDGSQVTGNFNVCTLLSSNENEKKKTIKLEPKKDIMNAKKECLSLGFRENTEKFGDCVMELIK